jgi:choline dehydrogenase-like flavoprotein
MLRQAQHEDDMEAETFDYIVVGGGSAGCILAERLSADAKTRVLVLEAGGIDRNWLLHLPIGAARVWNNPTFNWSYQSAPEPHANGRSIYHPRGKVLGGSAAINMMAYVRGNPGDYDRWAQIGLSEWSYDKVLPYFRACESFKNGADDWRGGEGPILTQRHPAADPLLDAWLEAGKRAGYSITSDYNGKNQEGFDRFQFNIGQGRRSNSAVRFLRPALKRTNLKVVTSALVDKLVFDGTRARGVEYEVAGTKQSAAARAEIIMAAGAYNTPQILMRSGVGPADHLQSIGIAPLLDRRNVGANLQDHPAVGLDYKRKRPGDLYNQIRLDRLGLNLLRAWYLRSGPATLPIASATAFVRSAPEMEIPDIQLLMRGYSPEMGPWFPFLKTSKPDGLGVTACHLRPHARGNLKLASPDPHVAPIFVNNFLDNEFDRRAMRNGFKIARHVMTQAAFDDVRADERLPGKNVRSDDEIDGYIRETVRTVFHPCGTCRMGTDDGSVVDPQLRVRGLTGLRIADASIMPDVVGGNINACVMMIALKAAHTITGRL